MIIRSNFKSKVHSQLMKHPVSPDFRNPLFIRLLFLYKNVSIQYIMNLLWSSVVSIGARLSIKYQNPCIPVSRSVRLDETHQNMKTLLDAIDYKTHQWSICSDFLMGMQTGFTKFCCFLVCGIVTL